MSDTTQGSLTVYKTTPRDAAVLVAFICEELFNRWDDLAGEALDRIVIEHHYAGECSTGAAYTLAELQLPDTVLVWADEPKYEFLGSRCDHAPGLGWFTAQCSADGEVQLGDGELLALVDDPEATLESVREEIRKRTGAAWTEAVKNVGPQPDEVVAASEEVAP